VVRAVCREACTSNESVEPANFNSPAQVVIAGHKAAVERGMELARSRGAKRAVLLPMSVPSHCGLMRPAAERMREKLAGISFTKGSVPVIQNADVASTADLGGVKDALVRQLYQPVRWVETVRQLVSSGATRLIECGPGRVLAGLNKRIAPEAQHQAFADESGIREALVQLGLN
jgi:[acyl-carrier-protein] S-malonyltransferase